MPSPRNIPYHIGAFVFVAAFIAYKWQYLGLPLYWDEAWVYGPAVKTMHANGLSLLPDTIGVELSRGHPLLFHFMAAVWASGFGASNFSLHLFALSMAVALLLCTYLIGSRLGSPLIGLAALSMVGLNEIFLAQSGMLLPEVALGLFMLIAAWAFMSHRWIGYIIAASCALLIKESAIVMILALVCWHLCLRLIGKHSEHWVKQASALLVPLLPAVAFLLYQRLSYGWFLFPEHLGLISWNIRNIHYFFKFGYRELFERQGMELATLAFGLVAPLAWKGWNKGYLSLTVVALYITAIKVLDGKWTLAPLPTLIVALACLGAVLFLQFVPMRKQEGLRGEFPAVALILIMGFLLFSALNFFSDRYLTGMLPFVAIGMSAVLYGALAPRSKFLFPVFMLVIAGNLFWHIGISGHVGDTCLSYQDDIRVHQSMVEYCEAGKLQSASLCGSFMDITYMTDFRAGYLTDTVPFLNISAKLADDTQYALVSQASSADLLEQLHALHFIRIKQFDSGPAWCALYERQTNLSLRID